MKRILFVLALLSYFSGSFAQFQVGHRTITFQDPARSNRNIETEVYYPGTTAGDNAALANGQFPIVVYGHGFLMGVSAYENVWTVLVPMGYIVALPKTESGTPDHLEFGRDLAFLINQLKSEGTNSSSPFYQKVSATSAIMGHSMGGGAAFLACENNSVPNVMVTFAAANTNPSSIHAATNVSIPAMVIAGEMDCVAPPDEHQTPMFDSLSSPCKTFISIKNGGHCNFADYNFICTTGEESCHPGGVPLSRAEQQLTAMNFVMPYLDYFLKGNNASWNNFLDSLNNSTKVTSIHSCTINPSAINTNECPMPAMTLFPNPASGQLNISFAEDKEVRIEITGITGNKLFSSCHKGRQVCIDISHFCQGIYWVTMIGENGQKVTQKFIKM